MHRPVFIDCIGFNLTLLEVIKQRSDLRHQKSDRIPHINTTLIQMIKI